MQIRKSTTLARPEETERDGPVQAPAARSGPDRAERLLMPAAFITCLGNSVQLTAAALLVLNAEGTTLSVGWLFIAVAVPQAALSLFFGRLADRFDRRTLCVLADLASASVAFALPIWLLLGGSAGLAAYLVNFLLASVAALFMPASNALIKERIRPERVGRFNANFEIATQAGTLLSAAIGGFLIQLYGVTPLFVFNGGTFLASAALMVMLGRRPLTAGADPDEGREAADTPAVNGPTLRRLGLLYALGNVVITVSNTILVVLVIEAFQKGAGLLGLVDALAGIGILAAAATYKRVSTRMSNLRIATVGYLSCAAVIAMEPFHPVGLMILIPFAGMSFGLARISARTMLMNAAHETRVGRIFGATNALGLALSVAVTLVVSRIADETAVRYAFFTLALLVAVTAIATISALRKPPEIVPSSPLPADLVTV